jgi:hypothetical protein
MALPQNPQGVTNTDRILLEAVNAQTQNLQGQTKVLHTVSDRLIKQNKEFQSLRKDMQEMGKTLLQGQGSNLSEIKKYFEKNKSNFRERPMVGNNSNKNSDDKGFFRNMMGKLFGPSKYQQKMMEDTSQILSLTELVSSDIGFIREKYSDSARAKERELLATAIAERINGSDSGGGGGLLKGLLGGLLGFGTILGTGIIELIKGFGNLTKAIANIAGPIGLAVAAALAGILSSIKSALDNLAKGFGSEGIGDLDRDRKRNRTGQGRGSTGSGLPSGGEGSPGGGGYYGGGPNQQRLPGPNQERLPGPNQQRLPGGRFPLLSNASEAVEDAVIKREIIRGAPSGPTASVKSGTLASTLRRFLGGLGIGLALEPSTTNEGNDEFFSQRNKALDDQAKFAATDPRRIEFMQKGNSKGGAKAIPGMFSESGEQMVKGLDGKYYPSMKDALLYQAEDFAKDSIKTVSDVVTDNLGKMAKSTLSLFDSIFEDFLAPLGNKTISLIDTAFQFPITVDGKTEMLDLAPGLGTATAKVLKEIADETKDLVGAGMDKAGDVITQINNNSNQTASAPMPFSAATPKSVHEATMDLYKIYYGKIR